MPTPMNLYTPTDVYTLDDVPDGSIYTRVFVDDNDWLQTDRVNLQQVAYTGQYADLVGQPVLAEIAISGSYHDLVDITFSDVATTGMFYDLLSIPDVLSSDNIGNVATLSDIPTTTSALTNDSGFIASGALTSYVPKTTTVNGHALSGNVTVTSSDLSLATVATSGSYVDLSNKPVPSFATTTRTVGTAFQISTTRNAQVSYTIPVTSAAIILTGSQASAILKYADNSTMTTNVVTVTSDQFGASSGIGVTVIGSLKLIAIIPANKWVQITTSNISGTPTYGTLSAQEVLIG